MVFKEPVVIEMYMHF